MLRDLVDSRSGQVRGVGAGEGGVIMLFLMIGIALKKDPPYPP